MVPTVLGRCWRVWSDSELLFPWGGQWVVESGGGCSIGGSGASVWSSSSCCAVAFVNNVGGGRERVSQGWLVSLFFFLIIKIFIFLMVENIHNKISRLTVLFLTVELFDVCSSTHEFLHIIVHP